MRHFPSLLTACVWRIVWLAARPEGDQAAEEN
jgi:hypothetical protein